MKKICLLFVTVISLSTHAQDVIVKRDGSTILSKVIEVNPSDIKYKKYSNLKGPTYTILKAEIMAINYENGDKDTFNNDSQISVATDQSQSNRYVPKVADNRNAEIIALYNKEYQPTTKLKKRKKIDGYMMIMGVKESSVMSNEDIEITFLRLVTDPADKPSTTYHFYEHVVYNINIKNKTNRTIYIDKGNCFKIMDDGSAYCFFNPTEQTSVNIGNNSGASLGLGALAGALGIGGIAGGIASGIGIGGGNSQSVSTLYSSQRIIAIPPHGEKLLSKEKSVLTRKSMSNYYYRLVEKSENFDITELCSSEIRTYCDYIDMGETCCTGFRLPNDLVKMGEVLNYNENNSPYSRQYIITYSTEENFQTYSSVKVDLYLRQLIGCDKLRKHNEIQSANYIKDINQYTIEGYYETE